jgi:hypothetical protein
MFVVSSHLVALLLLYNSIPSVAFDTRIYLFYLIFSFCILYALQQSPKVCGKCGAESANPSRGLGLPKPSFLGRLSLALAASSFPPHFYVSLLLKRLRHG